MIFPLSTFVFCHTLAFLPQKRLKNRPYKDPHNFGPEALWQRFDEEYQNRHKAELEKIENLLEPLSHSELISGGGIAMIVM